MKIIAYVLAWGYILFTGTVLVMWVLNDPFMWRVYVAGAFAMLICFLLMKRDLSRSN